MHIYGGITFDAAAGGMASGSLQAQDASGIELQNQDGVVCLKVTNDCKVGINTVTPTAALDVNGDAKISGPMTLGVALTDYTILVPGNYNLYFDVVVNSGTLPRDYTTTVRLLKNGSPIEGGLVTASNLGGIKATLSKLIQEVPLVTGDVITMGVTRSNATFNGFIELSLLDISVTL